MPRETVKDLSGMFDVQVGWSENTVQLGIATADGKSITDALGEFKEATSLWSTLDENTIDNLIRMLNKARYKAFPDS